MPAEQLIEKLALAIWNRLPYDHEAGCPTCPTLPDAINALRLAMKEAGILLSQPEHQ